MPNIITGDASGRIFSINADMPAGNTLVASGVAATSEQFFASQSAPIPNTMWYPGRAFELKMYGTFGTALIVPSIRGKIYFNTTLIGDTGAITNAASLTNKQWFGEMLITVVSVVGNTAYLIANGSIQMQTGVGNVTLPLVNSAIITHDITGDTTCRASAQWSALSTNNTITLLQMFFKG